MKISAATEIMMMVMLKMFDVLLRNPRLGPTLRILDEHSQMPRNCARFTGKGPHMFFAFVSKGAH